MELETLAACSLCGDTRFRPYLRIDEWRLVQCVRCKVVLLNPRPSDSERENVYNNYYGYPPMPTDPADKRHSIDLQEYWVAPLNRVRQPGTLLDVGCGSGAFLARARYHGWIVRGTDVAPHCVKYAREELGLQVNQGELSQLNLGERFDVVCLLHVLEHFADPRAQVLAAKQLLCDDGLLYVSLPNHTSFDARRQGLKWEGWAMPWHFFHFAPPTLKNLLESCGFQIVGFEFSLTVEFNKPWVGFPSRFLPRDTLARIFSGTSMNAFARIAPKPY